MGRVVACEAGRLLLHSAALAEAQTQGGRITHGFYNAWEDPTSRHRNKGFRYSTIEIDFDIQVRNGGSFHG
jgi:hypothetical protein